MKYGMEGYGLYWYCLELICDGIDAHNLTFNLEHDSEIIAHDTGIHYERVQEMMSYMVNLELFEMNQGIITCMKMAKRLDMSMTSKPAFRKSIQEARGNHDRVMTGSGGGHELEENRIEENRVEESNGSDEPTPSSTKKPKRQTLKNYIAECKEIGVDPIPLDSIAFRKSDTMGIPHDIVDVCWFKFKDYWIENKKRSVKTDWVLAFSNCLEGNGYDCYAQNQNGEIYLTTKGKNAQKLMVAENG